MLSITVASCAYSMDRWEELVLAMASIAEQTSTPDDTILVIDHNDALLERALAAFPDVRVIPNERSRGASGARNTACIHARGDVIVFLDDDARATPTWLAEITRPFEDPRVAGVGGTAVPDWQGDRPAWLPHEFDWVVGCSYRGLPATTDRVRNLIGTNMSVRRSIMASVGGFREGFGNVAGDEGESASAPRLSTGEETEFCIRVMRRLPKVYWLYVPSAVVFHRVPRHRATFRYFLSRCWIEGRGKEQLSRLAGSTRALASERSYVAKVLPMGIAHEAALSVRENDPAALARVAAILLGLATTGIGYVTGSLRHLIRSGGQAVDA